MRYLAICAIWLACYFLTPYTGELWDANFHLSQSLVSVFLLFVVLKLSDEWWTKEFGALCVIQILHNFGDAFFYGARYDEIQAILNTLEAIVLFGAGGMTQILRMCLNGQASNRSGPPNGSLSTVHSAQRGRDAI